MIVHRDRIPQKFGGGDGLAPRERRTAQPLFREGQPVTHVNRLDILAAELAKPTFGLAEGDSRLLVLADVDSCDPELDQALPAIEPIASGCGKSFLDRL